MSHVLRECVCVCLCVCAYVCINVGGIGCCCVLFACLYTSYTCIVFRVCAFFLFAIWCSLMLLFRVWLGAAALLDFLVDSVHYIPLVLTRRA